MSTIIDTEITSPSVEVINSVVTFDESTIPSTYDNIKEDIIPSIQEVGSMTAPFTGVYSNQSTKKTIQPLDIAKEWVDSENDEELYHAKTIFLEMAERNMKKENYVIVHRGYNIVRYMSDNSQAFFRLAATHQDIKTGKISCLYEWKLKGKSFYILAIDDVDSYSNKWLEERRDFYNNVATKGYIQDGKFDKKSYSILRRNCYKDFTNKFTSTWFYKDFDTAKRAIIMKVDGHVSFIKSV